MGGVGDARAQFQRHEHIAFSRHHHTKTLCLQQGPEYTRQIQGIIFFVTVTADRTLIETAMSGIEHDRLHAADIFDHVRPQLRFECFCQVNAGNEYLSVVHEHGKAQPIPHAIDQHLATIDAKLQFVFVAAELDVLVVNYGVGEAVELGDVIDAKEIAAVHFDNLPLHRGDEPARAKAGTNCIHSIHSKAPQAHCSR